ncbi:LANO_0C08702g1_1 [Lachancea nothofagi CBS 11611]|uniref:LANO_0C08702g1_1 n=1 Tax=Lachancea nothofagi CBS 11611 TaxID=1266666 RepID=A0A1G4JA23_9SACH|nr:LANO_0C08702g1_1 [Lachancea nothofagi CBS 11611]
MTRPHRSKHLRPAEQEQDQAETEFKDENGIIHTTTRSLRKVNYAEDENNYNSMEDDDDDEEDGVVRKTARNRKRTDLPEGDQDFPVVDELAEHNHVTASDVPADKPKAYTYTDEDESFHEDDLEEPEDEDAAGGSADEYLSEESIKRSRRRADQNFIVSDEEDDDDDGADPANNPIKNSDPLRPSYPQDQHVDTDDDDELRSGRNFRSSTIQARRGRRNEISPPRKLRRRGRSAYMAEDGESRSERISLADELRELRDDSPIREKRSLRERTKPVNYTLPPPLPDNSIDEYTRITNDKSALAYPSPRGRRRLPTGQSFGPLRRLFPTGGPFGGNDVTAIFGTNTNLYETSNGNENGSKLLLDSDSSEDEILPLGATSTKEKKVNSKKKKSEIADLDPLGVDMNIKFEDVGGLDNYIDQLKEMVALPLLYPELYQKFGITPPRGVLFHGPPGTGKTLMARALAASCSTEQQKITFFMRKGADILSKWVGEAERQLRLLFDEAKKHQPSIIFFDEIDGLAPVRSSKQEQIHASIVSTLLALMDGMDNRGQVIVIGATNRPDAVDPALRRPGRFDREFFFPLPDLEARSKILEIQTKKWNPPLPKRFIDKMASLTKGYGGADLRALCTEAALVSIQRKLPQIYQSDTKLSIDPSTVNVKARDFMAALEKIVPSSARAVGNSAQPLPETTKMLLDEQLDEIKGRLLEVMPLDSTKQRTGKSTIKHYLEYEDDDSSEEEDGFLKAEFLRNVTKARTCKPRLMITGARGNGQQYIGAAVLHHLEDFNVQMLDVGNLVSDSSRSVEAAIVQNFSEARKRQPSVLYVPNIEIWLQTIPENAILTLASLLSSLKNTEKVLLLAVANDLKERDCAEGILAPLDLGRAICKIRKPSSSQRSKFFNSITELLKMKPSSFDSGKKRREPLPILPAATSTTSVDDIDENGQPLTDEAKLLKSLKLLQSHDMKLKNTLKIKLSGLMDLFKNRYKRFRKPPIDDAALVHLFEQNTALHDNPDYQPAYIKEDNMILECLTGRRFFNMDLDIVEERLWNGFYSEPRQFLKDIELIYRDAHTSRDRERIIKASEMFVNAQMGIEEISVPGFVQDCKAARQRELTRQKLYSKKEAELNSSEDKEEVISQLSDAELRKEDLTTSPEESNQVSFTTETIANAGVGSGSQLQCQSRIDSGSCEELASDPSFKANTGNGTNSVSNETSSIEPNEKEKQGGADSKENNDVADERVDVNESSEQTHTETISVPNQRTKPAKQRKLPSPNVILDEDKLQVLLRELEQTTKGFTVEQLEEHYASIVSIIWAERLSLDKSHALEKLAEVIRNA